MAIAMVVMGHFVRQSGLLESETGINGSINVFLGSGARIAVNIFILIGSWFMVDSSFKPARAVKLYLETAFYCIPITLLMAATGEAGGTRNILQGMLPFLGRPVWFASAYISLILLAPFLNNAFLLPAKKQTCLAGLLFFLYCAVSTIPSFSNIDYIADFSWFCAVYISVGWAKKNGIIEKLRINRWIAAASALLLYIGLCMAASTPLLAWPANYWLDNIRTLPNIACAFGLFYFFLKTDIGAIGIINFLARSVFAVYIVHQVPAFREFEWKTLCRANAIAGLPPAAYALSILCVAISVPMAIAAFDIVRIKLFDAIETRIQKGRAP